MHEFLNGSTYFCVTLTLVAFAFGAACQKKFKLAILNPILIGAAIVMVALHLLNIPNETYQSACRVLSYLLTPATICLAISFYEQFQRLKKHLIAICVGVLAGTVASLGTIYLLGLAFGLDRVLTLSLLPKSITTAIGVALSEEIGGIAAITTAAIAVTGNRVNTMQMQSKMLMIRFFILDSSGSSFLNGKGRKSRFRPEKAV